ncbi:ferredoxin family protein [Pontiella sp.]|uniref:ferredoxin family protein n=1 Tax=Pontiella sp. TaxID=2837462 RepID=UPI0035677E6A
MSPNKPILICQCAERGLVEIGSVPRDVAAVIVPDLCKAAAARDPRLANEFAEIHACHPRAVRALFDFAGHPLGAGVDVVNHRDPAIRPSGDPSFQSNPAWYPVIDYNRCTACGQCHEFCLFGVYEKTDEGRVVVAHPGSCKNNCPACARICPETAIIFPKVGESPINGAEITDEDQRKANVKINVDEILGDDVYAALNARKQKRRSLLDQKKIDKALEERRKCSEKKL